MKRATTSAEAPAGEGERVSEQANQLHNPPVMFNEREITFYTFLHSCDKHAVFFLCVWECYVLSLRWFSPKRKG